MIATPSRATTVQAEKTVFFYVGSADATVKPVLLKLLRGPAIVKFPHHRSIDTYGQTAHIVEELRGCAAEGFAQVIIIGDVQADGYDNSIGVCLDALRIAHQGSLCGVIETVEMFLATDIKHMTPGLFKNLSLQVEMFRTAPYTKVYILTERPQFAEFVTAMTTVVTPSRMATIGEGLSALRQSRKSALFLFYYAEASVPNIQKVARLSVDRALLDVTFSSRSDQGEVPPLDRIGRLLTAHKVGIDEPTPVNSFTFELQRTKYRDTLLHPLVSTLLRYSSDESTFLGAVDALVKELGTRSPALASTLADLRNNLVAVRRGIFANPVVHDIKQLDVHADQAVRDIVMPLVREFRFAVWPLLGSAVGPQGNAPGFRGLYQEYERCITTAECVIREIVMRKLRVRQEEMKEIVVKTAAEMQEKWQLATNSFLLVHPELTTDRRDELWPYEDRCGFLGLLHRELPT